jgi:hypothetical protein
VVVAGAVTLEALRCMPALLRTLFAPLFAAFAIWLVLQKTAAAVVRRQLLFVGWWGIAALTPRHCARRCSRRRSARAGGADGVAASLDAGLWCSASALFR